MGISPHLIRFKSVTMESDKYICVVDDAQEASQLVIINMADPSKPERLSIKAESAIMNPASKLIALRGTYID